MKKVILALAIVSVSFAACNSGETKEGTTTPTDTTTVAPVVVDTTVKTLVDTAVKMVVDTTKK